MPWDSRTGGGSATRTQQQIETAVLDYVDAHSGGGIGLNALDHGVLGDGTTDDTPAMQTFVNGNAGKLCWLPNRTYKMLGNLTIPPGTAIWGDGAIILGGGIASGDRWWPGSDCEFRGLYFKDRVTGIAHDYTSGVTVTGIDVQGCTFENISKGVNADANIGVTYPKNWIVRGNRFLNCTCAFFGMPCDGMLIEGNWITSNNAAGGQPILFYGGSRNRVINNRLDGPAVTGILWLYTLASVGGSTGKGLVVANEVHGNIITDVTEESISFEGAVLETDTVASTTTPNKVTLAAAGWSGAGSTYAGFHMVFYSGALAGQCFLITAETNGLFTLDIDATTWALIAASDKVSIGAASLRNSIVGNAVEAATSGDCTGINVYNLSVGNTVQGNTVRGNSAQLPTHQHGIAVRALQGLAKSSPTYANNFGAGPACFNTVMGNTVEDGDIEADLLNFGGSSFVSPGTIVRGNTVRKGKVHVSFHGVARDVGGTLTSTPGAVATVSIPHGLAAAPTFFNAERGNANARGAPAYNVTADATNVILNFASNLTAATSYSWNWTASLLPAGALGSADGNAASLGSLIENQV